METGFICKEKELALELAQLLYEVYKQQTDIIESGQNDAQQISKE